MSQVVYVIPFAGGTSASFLQWKNKIGFEKCVFLDFPGKGIYKQEKFLNNFSEYVDYAEKVIFNHIKENNVCSYKIWGHSMGSLIAYEICKGIDNTKELKPELLVMTSTMSPDSIDRDKIMKILKDNNEFKKYILEMGLISERVINSRYYHFYYGKILKHDYKVLLSYKERKTTRIDQKTLIINGREDSTILENQMRRWSDYFISPPTFKLVDGKHFFILKENFEPLKLIAYEENSNKKTYE